MGKLNDQLKEMRKRAGLSVRKLASELGVPPSSYAAYEDAAKFKKPIIPLDFANRLADIFERNGVERIEVLALAGITGEVGALLRHKPEIQDEWLTVTGAVAAGVWKAETEWPVSEQYDVRFGVSEYTKEQRFAVRMEGNSMNRTVPSGADMECLWVKFSPIPPKPGDLVIAQRTAHDLVELTCKRLALIGDQYALVAESFEPEFQAPIIIGRPDDNDHTDNEIRIIGIVISAKLNLAQRDLSERRYRT